MQLSMHDAIHKNVQLRRLIDLLQICMVAHSGIFLGNFLEIS